MSPTPTGDKDRIMNSALICLPVSMSFNFFFLMFFYQKLLTLFLNEYTGNMVTVHYVQLKTRSLHTYSVYVFFFSLTLNQTKLLLFYISYYQMYLLNARMRETFFQIILYNFDREKLCIFLYKLCRLLVSTVF